MAELHKRGIVAVVACSTPFVNLGRIQSAQLGAPGLPLLVIPHPVGGIALAHLVERAEVFAAQVIEFVKGRMA